INTTMTTLIAVLAFLILGSQSIFGFAIALVVGLIAGTSSSLFLASQLWIVFPGKNLKEKPIDFRITKRVEGPQVSGLYSQIYVEIEPRTKTLISYKK